MNKPVLGKTMQKGRKHRDIKLVTPKYRRNYLESKPNYHTTKFFTENLLAIEMRKAEKLINKPVHLGPSILDLSKISMYKFWYDYIKPNYGEKQNCVIWIQVVSLHNVKADDIYIDIAEDAETRFDTSSYELDRPLHKGKNEKAVGLIKGKLRGKS